MTIRSGRRPLVRPGVVGTLVFSMLAAAALVSPRGSRTRTGRAGA